MKRICVIGAGYVGLTTGACFADLGNDVVLLDIDQKRIQNLGKDWTLKLHADGQWADGPLFSNEQFGMGGADSVRGYFERETASDIGRRFSLEGYSPDFGSWIGSNWRARALVFADTARGHDNEPVRDPLTPENKLGSFGLGARASQGKSFAFRLDVARVTQDAGTRLKGEYRAHGAVAYSF